MDAMDTQMEKIMKNIASLKLEPNSELDSALKELQAALKAGEYSKEPEKLTKGAVLLVADQTEKAMPYLTEVAKKALLVAPKANNLSKVVDGKHYKSIFYGIQIKTRDLHVAIEKMAYIVNELADNAAINSILAPISSLKLAKMPCEADRSVVFFFPMVEEYRIKELSKNQFFMLEGEAGKPYGDMELDLEPGHFVAAARVGIQFQARMVAGYKEYDVSNQLFNEGATYLRALQ